MKRLASIGFISFTLFLATFLVSWNKLPHINPIYKMPDGKYYTHIAKGEISDVPQPFNKRILHPYFVKAFSALTSLELWKSFFFIALINLFFFCFLLTYFIKQADLPAWTAIPLLLTPALSQMFYDYELHDLFYGVEVAFFSFLLVKKKYSLALLLLIPLFLTREATLLLSLVLTACFFFHKRWTLAATTIFISLGSMLLSGYLSHHGLPNKHQLSNLFYIPAKMIFNFCGNFLGLNIWTNTLDYCSPSFTKTLPAWLTFGKIQNIGFCGFDFSQPLHTLISLLTVFGIGPLFLLFFLRSHALRKMPLGFFILFFYGFFSFILGPVLGPGGFRLMAYGWPLFWIALPFLLAPSLRFGKKEKISLLTIHCLVIWLPFLFHHIPLSTNMASFSVFLFVVGLYSASFSILIRFYRIQSDNQSDDKKIIGNEVKRSDDSNRYHSHK